MKNPKFAAAFEKYFAGCEAAYMNYHNACGFSPELVNKFEYKAGRKYVKVIQVLSGGEQRSVHSFVNMENGEVLKPAGWAKPAKHARGNIFDENNGLGSMGPHGPASLR